MVVKAGKKFRPGKKNMNRHTGVVDSPQRLTDILAEAIRYHQSGNLAEAESLYCQILLNDHDNADALHLLGVTAYQSGNSKQAVESIERAIAINPSVSFYHNNLGNAFLNLNQTDNAVRCFNEALRLKPDNVEACNNLGNALRRQGENKKALKQYMKVIEMAPDYVAAINNLANLLKGEGRVDEAIMHYRSAIRLRPDLAEAYYNLGNLLKDSDEPEEAVKHYRKAISINPGFADAYNNIANILKRQKKYVEAAEHYRKAISINPDFTEAYTNLGDTYREQGRFDQAFKQCWKAINLNPAFGEAYVNLGNTFLDGGNFQEAVEQYNRAINLNPDLADAHYNKGIVLLLKGEFEEGWKEYEWRFKSKEIVQQIGFVDTDIPVWDGTPLNGRTILIKSEQGMGDHIQFARYLPLLKAQGGRVIYECHKSLIRLFESFEGIDTILDRSYQRGAGESPDVCINLLSLPGIFATTLYTIPADVPYFRVGSEAIERWKDRVDCRSFKIGLVWSGSSSHRNDRNRSCSLEDFAPLANVPDIALFSLQKGGINESENNLPANMRVIDIGRYLDDFHDTAAVMENLDLVISVDTSVAHLAGALGKTVWTLLPFVPDWRWMLKRENTPWYPTMRLFRQPKYGDWESVMKRIAHELKIYASLKGVKNE